MFGDLEPVEPAADRTSCPERGQDTGGTPMGRGPHSDTPSSVPVDPWVMRPGPNQRGN